jgi:DNA-directed RNA polymerase subunit RPC12/RpoP
MYPIEFQDPFLSFPAISSSSFISSANPSLPTSPYVPWSSSQANFDSLPSPAEVDFGLNPFFHPAQLYQNSFFIPATNFTTCTPTDNLLSFVNNTQLPMTPEAVSPDQILSPPVPSSPKQQSPLILPSQLSKKSMIRIKREASPELTSDPVSETTSEGSTFEVLPSTPARTRVRLNREPCVYKKPEKAAAPVGIIKCPHPGCTKTFSKVYSLHSHVCSHSTERPFKCDKCSAAFTRNHDLKRHQKIHLGVKPYKCSKCNRNFSRMDALGRHQQKKPECWLGRGRAK